ncbi:MAG: hypothetical protein M1812_003659 [Candelaria pacifica]|nr:MAG: hypothetical protein M1812_003659 [Candelaria pacifica]
MDIGRSSKSENKSLVASQDNAWFDSPVMSREHAIFSISPAGSEFVHLKDVKSMHGTFVNDLQLSKGKYQAVKNGDTIRFGSKVTRADETFYAREFRIGYEWKDPYPVSKPDHSTRLQPSLNIDVPLRSPQESQLLQKNDDSITHFEKGPLRTTGSFLGNFIVPDSDTDSSSSESIMDDSEPDEHRTSVSLETSAELSSQQPYSDGVGDELVSIEIESQSARCSAAASTKNDSHSPRPPRHTIDAKNEREGGSSHNPMMIDDDAMQDERDDEGPEVRYMGFKSVSVVEPLPKRRNNSPSEELTYKEDSKCQGSADEVESCESVMGDISDIEASEKSGLFAIYDNTSEGEETDEEWEQVHQGARRDAMSRTLSEAYLQAEQAFAETDEGSDFGIIDDDDAHEEESEDEPLSGDETELEPMSPDECFETMPQEIKAVPQVVSLSPTSSREPLTGRTKPDTVLVEDSQGQTDVPGVALPSEDSGNPVKTNTSGFLYVGEPLLNRAPSPSDAAMAKPAVNQTTFPDSQPTCELGTPCMQSTSQPNVDNIGLTQFSVSQNSHRNSAVRDASTKNFTFDGSLSMPHSFGSKVIPPKYTFPNLPGTNQDGYVDGPFACSSNYMASRSSGYGISGFDFDDSPQQPTYTQANSLYLGNSQYPTHTSRAYNAMNGESSGNSYWPPAADGHFLESSRPSLNVYPRHGHFGARGFVPKRTLNQDFQQTYGHPSRARPTVGSSKYPQPTKGPAPAIEQSLRPGNSGLNQSLLTQEIRGKEVGNDIMGAAPVTSKGNPRGVSINDIVEPAGPQEISLSIAGSKRKADEISSIISDEQQCDSAQQCPSAFTTEGTVLQDAQPRDLELRASQLSLPDSSLVEVQAQPQPRSGEEHINKKARMATASRSGFLKYAATALASAVLGGVGVFATLISLPEDA